MYLLPSSDKVRARVRRDRDKRSLSLLAPLN